MSGLVAQSFFQRFLNVHFRVCVRWSNHIWEYVQAKKLVAFANRSFSPIRGNSLFTLLPRRLSAFGFRLWMDRYYAANCCYTLYRYTFNNCIHHNNIYHNVYFVLCCAMVSEAPIHKYNCSSWRSKFEGENNNVPTRSALCPNDSARLDWQSL